MFVEQWFSSALERGSQPCFSGNVNVGAYVAVFITLRPERITDSSKRIVLHIARRCIKGAKPIEWFALTASPLLVPRSCGWLVLVTLTGRG